MGDVARFFVTGVGTCPIFLPDLVTLSKATSLKLLWAGVTGSSAVLPLVLRLLLGVAGVAGDDVLTLLLLRTEATLEVSGTSSAFLVGVSGLVGSLELSSKGLLSTS